MKPISKIIRNCALLMTALILFQSCVAYHKTPVSLNQAVQERTRSKIVKAGKTDERYGFITQENGRYYGVKMDKGNEIMIPIEDTPDTEVFLRDKRASKTKTTLLVFSTAGVAALIMIAILDGPCEGYYCL